MMSSRQVLKILNTKFIVLNRVNERSASFFYPSFRKLAEVEVKVVSMGIDYL